MGTMDRPKQPVEEKLFELIRDTKVCMLTTVDPEGHLRSRPMGNLSAQKGPDLWFFTRDDGGKAAEIREHTAVNLSYVSPRAHYISVTGSAFLVKDRAMIERLWRPAYSAWFPRGLDDPGLALLRVVIERAEYWESPGAVAYAFSVAKALLTGRTAKPGEHQKINHILH